jgi:two-component system nitrate/nitrite response regulator NarL
MILIATPSKFLRQRCRETLAGIFPIHEVSDTHALVVSLSQLKPPILFLDYDNKHFGSISFLRNIVKASPSTRVVVFTSNPNSDEAVAAIKAGAKGYVPKGLSKSPLRKVARVVSSGEMWIERGLIPILIQKLVDANGKESGFNLKRNQPELSSAFDGLSPREREIALWVGAGEHNKEISSRLSISEKTVKARLTTIFRKLGVSSRTQLALVMSQNDLIQKHSVIQSSTKALQHLSPSVH